VHQRAGLARVKNRRTVRRSGSLHTRVTARRDDGLERRRLRGVSRLRQESRACRALGAGKNGYERSAVVTERLERAALRKAEESSRAKLEFFATEAPVSPNAPSA